MCCMRVGISVDAAQSVATYGSVMNGQMEMAQRMYMGPGSVNKISILTSNGDVVNSISAALFVF